MKKIYYWCPYIGNIATIKAVKNSALSLIKYSKGKFIPTILNSCGEWDSFEKEFYEKKIDILNFKNFFRLDTTINGFLKSRLAYIKIFFSCFFLLKKTISKNKTDYLIAHLITSLPIVLFTFYNFDTKLIIRISGKIHMNFFRKIFWQFASKKIHLVTCPTEETKENLIKLGIIEKSKIVYLPDPIIDINNINLKKKEKNIEINKNDKYFLSIGRFTRQKNHILCIKSFKKILHKYPDIKLLIIGTGELKSFYLSAIKKYNLANNILIFEYKTNIFNYLNNCLAIISTSLWEDPGFVMIEAAATNAFIISSDCPSGPKEFVGNDSGLIFSNNNSKKLEQKIFEFLEMKNDEINRFKLNAKKKSIFFTKLRHFNLLKKYL